MTTATQLVEILNKKKAELASAREEYKKNQQERTAELLKYYVEQIKKNFEESIKMYLRKLEDFDPQKYVDEETEDDGNNILKKEIKGKIMFDPEDQLLDSEIIQHLKEIIEDFKSRGFTITYRKKLSNDWWYADDIIEYTIKF